MSTTIWNIPGADGGVASGARVRTGQDGWGNVNPEQAIQLLEPAGEYELGQEGGPLPVYLRGLAYLRAGDGQKAGVKFQKILDVQIPEEHGRTRRNLAMRPSLAEAVLCSTEIFRS